MSYCGGGHYGQLLKLLILCGSVALLFCGCPKTPPATTPKMSPIPEKTVNPGLSAEYRALESALLNGAKNALTLETKVLSQNSGVSSVRVPEQLLNQYLDALTDEAAWQRTADGYTLSQDSGGQFIYDKPYSALISGSSTDVYTIEDESGWIEEIVDNTRYDPFTWVMSGEGGGEFAYMTVYQLKADGSSGEIETVSSLNGSITGWSYDTFMVLDGHYRFIDIQLSPDVDKQDETPYQWVVCAGDISSDSARIEEFHFETDALSLRRDSLSLSLSADALSMEANRRGKRISLLTRERDDIQYIETP